MMREDVVVGMLVTALCSVNDGFCGIQIPAGTPGIVTQIKMWDDVYVEFELGRKSTTAPALCHPIYLRPLE